MVSDAGAQRSGVLFFASVPRLVDIAVVNHGEQVSRTRNGF
jgi:hypothetical protein